jgi:hypothetical protein
VNRAVEPARLNDFVEDNVEASRTNAEKREVVESFRLPEGKQVSHREGAALQVAELTSIVSVASHVFSFNENSNTPGRFLEQSVVVNVPPGAGFFVSMASFAGAFTTGNFQFLTERPLGQFFVSLFLRGNNFVCQVRLTDSNSDDPISINVTGVIVFFT